MSRGIVRVTVSAVVIAVMAVTSWVPPVAEAVETQLLVAPRDRINAHTRVPDLPQRLRLPRADLMRETDESIMLANEIEPNNSPGEANTLMLGTICEGTIYPASDVDWYRVYIGAPGKITVFMGNIPSGADYDIALYRLSGNYLYLQTYSAYNGNHYENLSWLVPSAGWYYIYAYPYSGSHQTHAYRLVALYSSTYDSLEPNDNLVTASNTWSGSRSLSMDNSLDHDWVKIPVSQPTKIMLTLKNMGPGADYDLYLYGPSGNLVGWSENVNNADENITYLATEQGDYHALARVWDWTSSATSYNWTIKSMPMWWYSQIKATFTESYYSYNNNRLDKLFFPNNTDPAKATMHLADHIKNWGCVAASYAMIFRNMNRRTTWAYDFRTGTSGYLVADPFTAILANTEFYPIVEEIPDQKYTCGWVYPGYPSYSPCYMQVGPLRSAFGVRVFRSTESAYKNLSEAQKAYYIHLLLKDYPEGVMLRLPNHTMVIVQSLFNDSDFQGITLPSNLQLYELAPGTLSWCDDEESDDIKPGIMSASVYEQGFIVCEPAAQVVSQGAFVKYSECHSFVNRGRRLNDSEHVQVVTLK